MTADRPQPDADRSPATAETTGQPEVWSAVAWLNRVAPAPRPDDRERNEVRVSGYF